MIRVLHVTTTGRLGGAERVICDVATASAKLGLTEPRVCVLGEPGGLDAALRSAGIAVDVLDLGREREIVSAIRRVRSLARAHRAAVVHTHLLHASVVGQLAARTLGIPGVLTRHYGDFLRRYGTTRDRLLDRAALALAHRVFAVSEDVRRAVVDAGEAPARRVSVIANGIDIGRVRSLGAVSTRGDATSELFAVGVVASLQPWKGHGVLIDAVAEIGARLVVVGAGPLADELHRRATQHQAQVEFLGHLDEPYAVVAGLDVYVQPSLNEGFGLAAVEAMALGRPVVASRVGGLPEVVEDRVTGLLVAPNDAHALASALRTLRDDPGLRVRLGNAGAERAVGLFSAERSARSYADAYRQLLH